MQKPPPTPALLLMDRKDLPFVDQCISRDVGHARVTIQYKALDEWMEKQTVSIFNLVKPQIIPDGEAFGPIIRLIAGMATEEPQLDFSGHTRIDGPLVDEKCDATKAGYTVQPYQLAWVCVSGKLAVGTNWYARPAESHPTLADIPYDWNVPARDGKPREEQCPFLHRVYMDQLHKRATEKWHAETPIIVAAQAAFDAAVAAGHSMARCLEEREKAYEAAKTQQSNSYLPLFVQSAVYSMEMKESKSVDVGSATSDAKQMSLSAESTRQLTPLMKRAIERKRRRDFGKNAALVKRIRERLRICAMSAITLLGEGKSSTRLKSVREENLAEFLSQSKQDGLLHPILDDLERRYTQSLESSTEDKARSIVLHKLRGLVKLREMLIKKVEAENQQ